jgi:hypothetical protein
VDGPEAKRPAVDRSARLGSTRLGQSRSLPRSNRRVRPFFRPRRVAGSSLLCQSIKPGNDRCISLSRHESLCRLPQRSLAGEELAVELVEAAQGPLDEIRSAELENRAPGRLRYRLRHLREKIVDGVITGPHGVAEQLPSFEGAVQIGKLILLKPNERLSSARRSRFPSRARAAPPSAP